MAQSLSLQQFAFIVNPRWQVLILKHPTSDADRPLWDFPGGNLEHGVGLRDDLIAHVKNSTNLDLSTVSIPLNITTYLDWVDRTDQIVRIIYLCLARGDVTLQSPYTEFQWIDSAEYEHFSFPDEGFVQAFQNYGSHSSLSSEEFLGSGILTDTLRYLQFRNPSPLL